MLYNTAVAIQKRLIGGGQTCGDRRNVCVCRMQPSAPTPKHPDPAGKFPAPDEESLPERINSLPGLKEFPCHRLRIRGVFRQRTGIAAGVGAAQRQNRRKLFQIPYQNPCRQGIR
jgi:hypothetical protein